jgi:archaellum component FlaF (FlaF/FlaG flagellin family)
MGFGAVFATIVFIFIFATAALFASTTQKSLQESASAAQARHVSNIKEVKESLRIDEIDYMYGAEQTWTDDLYRDFAGATSDTLINGNGSILLNDTPYQDGTYTSQEIDTGVSGTNFTTISWTSIEPGSTAIGFQARAANSSVALQAASFTGPDGTAATYYTLSGGNLNATLSNNQYFQYKAYLNTTNPAQTPELQAVMIGVQRPIGHILLNVTNDGAVALEATETDVYAPSRIARNNSLRTITVNDIKNQAFLDPGESMSIAIFTTLAAGETVTVSNDAASVSAVVSP